MNKISMLECLQEGKNEKLSQVFDTGRGLGREELEGVEGMFILHRLIDLVYNLHG